MHFLRINVMVYWGMDGEGTGTIYVRVTFLPWAFSFLSLWTSPPAVFLPLLSLRLLVPFTSLACPFCISVLQDSALWLKWREVKVAQLCPALCNPMDCPWNSPGQNTWVGSLSLLQGIFPTQGSNPGLPHCRWDDLYQLSHKGSPPSDQSCSYSAYCPWKSHPLSQPEWPSVCCWHAACHLLPRLCSECTSFGTELCIFPAHLLVEPRWQGCRIHTYKPPWRNQYFTLRQTYSGFRRCLIFAPLVMYPARMNFPLLCGSLDLLTLLAFLPPSLCSSLISPLYAILSFISVWRHHLPLLLWWHL